MVKQKLHFVNGGINWNTERKLASHRTLLLDTLAFTLIILQLHHFVILTTTLSGIG